MIEERKSDEFDFLKPKLISSRIYPEFFQLHENERIVNLGCGNGPQVVAYSGNFNEMVGVDINEERVSNSLRAAEYFGVQNYKAIYANVEQTPLDDGSFDKALAVDIIEHVQSPSLFCNEIHRLLKDDGQVLITFPAMHDRYKHFVSKMGDIVLRRKGRHDHSSENWDPDTHNSDYPTDEWIAIVEASGFRLVRSKASTMFPPLHLYDVPKFWFSNNAVHSIDSKICGLPVVKNYGQALLCVFTKVSQ